MHYLIILVDAFSQAFSDRSFHFYQMFAVDLLSKRVTSLIEETRQEIEEETQRL